MIDVILPPEKDATLVGYAAIIKKYELEVPLPAILSAISIKHKKYETSKWQIFTPRHKPEDNLYSHLTFALKYEALDLAVLHSIFLKTTFEEIEQIVKTEPNGVYARKIWFLYEYLLDRKLNIQDLEQGNFVDLIDSKIQYTGPKRNITRHRIRNNLPGVKNFCPLIKRTEKLDKLINKDLYQELLKNTKNITDDILSRAANFLLLEDSKASYAIEGETPTHHRAQRWGKIIGQAGNEALSKELLEKLQREVISDNRFIRMGYRKEGGFVGSHDRTTNHPIPSHISAKHQDIETLLEGLIETEELLKNSDFNPVLAATLIAFGFVFIHPFEDGNGRIHRYLLHHIISRMGFKYKNLTFPISAIILQNISKYALTLESYSRPRLPLVKWRTTENGNIDVLNETLDLYRFFDATSHAEFLYECVNETITKALPEETLYIKRYDIVKKFINDYVDMPERKIDLLLNFLYQNSGSLSKRARTKEFSALTDKEIKIFENKFSETFEL